MGKNLSISFDHQGFSSRRNLSTTNEKEINEMNFNYFMVVVNKNFIFYLASGLEICIVSRRTTDASEAGLGYFG